MGTSQNKMRVVLLLSLCVFAAADDLFKPEEEVVLLEEQAEPTQNQPSFDPYTMMGLGSLGAATGSFGGPQGGSFGADPLSLMMLYGLGMGSMGSFGMNPMMMGGMNPMMMGGYGMNPMMMGMMNPMMMGMMNPYMMMGMGGSLASGSF